MPPRPIRILRKQPNCTYYTGIPPRYTDDIVFLHDFIDKTPTRPIDSSLDIVILVLVIRNRRRHILQLKQQIDAVMDATMLATKSDILFETQTFPVY